MDKTIALVMAAGLSRRFGRDKRLATLKNGNTLISQTVAAISSANFEYRIAIQPNDLEAFASLFPEQCLITVDHYKKGMAHSITTAIRSIQHDFSSCLICLADMPYVSPATYTAIAHALNGFDAVVPYFQGIKGNPVAISHTLFDRFLALEGDVGGKHILNDDALNLFELEVDDPGILKDIDLPTDL